MTGGTLLGFKTLIRHLLLACLYWLLGLLAGGAWFLVYFVDSLPDLSVWHTVELEAEYDARRHAGFTSLAEYQALERELFQELEQQVYAVANDATGINRFRRGSRVDPTSYAVNSNRTREFPVESPRAGVLLLHGLSDSPYSLLQLARTLHAEGSYVVLPRLPGHGTAPAGLVKASAEDFKAVVRLAARHLRRQVGSDVPIYLVGYSNGAALAVDYALDVMDGEPLPVASRLVLISPAIGVSGLAALAPWQRRIAMLPGLEKLAWQSVQPEYDPYKYNSFPLNAAEQVYNLTQNLTQRLASAEAAGELDSFPPTLVFTSAVDATVSVNATVDNLLSRLSGNQHRLIMYDVNQESNTAFLFSDSAILAAENLLARRLPFAVEVFSNGPTDSSELVAMIKSANSDSVEIRETQLHWPGSLYSLSHVALPFSPVDPVYGDVPQIQGRPASLGNVTLRGERGILQVPINQLMRLRYNPFYSYQQERILGFMFGPALTQ
ncbi:MAG: hypothetical protein CMK89_18355 [Pseudomonadales bacterium]|nr:hypothetical protein [Pseudomonadales bacterium]